MLRNFRIPSNTPVRLWRGRDHFVAYTGACLLVVLVDLPLLEISLQEHDNFYKAMKWTFEHDGIDGWEALCYLYHIWYLPLDLAHWCYEVMPPYAEDSKAAGKENKPDLLNCFKTGLLTNALPAEEPGYYTLEVYPPALPCISPEQQWLLTRKIEPTIDTSGSTVQTIWYGMLDTDSYDG